MPGPELRPPSGCAADRSSAMTRTLDAGSFFGRAAHRRDSGGLHLSEHEYAPGLVVPSHAHERAYVCLVVAGGYVERVGRDTRQCPSATVLFHPAGEEHAETFAPCGGRILHVELPPRVMDAVRASGLTMSEARLAGGEAAVLARRIRSELHSWDSASPLVVEGLTLQLLACFERAARPRLREPAWLRRVVEVLRERFRERLTLAEIAREAGVAPTHLSRIFRAHRRCTVGEYVRRLRVEHGCRALATTDAPLSEIALDAGFADQAHFTRVFCRHIGTTPLRYRRGR
jgi:AraC family transcriptional regulator